MALLEVICLHEHDAKRAAEGGADRIELVGTMDDGGLAPSPELLARTLSAVDIPVRPMLRLDGGFRADPRHREEMLHLVRTYRDLGADGPALGFLDKLPGSTSTPSWSCRRAGLVGPSIELLITAWNQTKHGCNYSVFPGSTRC